MMLLVPLSLMRRWPMRSHVDPVVVARCSLVAMPLLSLGFMLATEDVSNDLRCGPRVFWAPLATSPAGAPRAAGDRAGLRRRVRRSPGSAATGWTAARAQRWCSRTPMTPARRRSRPSRPADDRRRALRAADQDRDRGARLDPAVARARRWCSGAARARRKAMFSSVVAMWRTRAALLGVRPRLVRACRWRSTAAHRRAGAGARRIDRAGARSRSMLSLGADRRCSTCRSGSASSTPSRSARPWRFARSWRPRAAGVLRSPQVPPGEGRQAPRFGFNPGSRRARPEPRRPRMKTTEDDRQAQHARPFARPAAHRARHGLRRRRADPGASCASWACSRSTSRSTSARRSCASPTTSSVIRLIMYWAMVVAGGISLYNILFARTRWLAASAFFLVAASALLGGAKVPVNNFADHTPYIGLDWFILDLLGSSLIFVFIEKLFALRREQPVFRAEWQVDMQHFIVNHMIVGFVLLATNLLVHKLFGWAAKDGIQAWVRDLPYPVALFLIILVADLVQYATHRAYHEVPALWRLHAVHHSVKSMDWLAGSRQHVAGAADHAHAGARADLRAGLRQERDRHLHRDRRLPGGVQPRQRQRAPRAAALPDRHAQLPPLAPLAGRRGDRQELRRALRVHRLPVRHRREVGPASGPSSTASSATTCPTASGSR